MAHLARTNPDATTVVGATVPTNAASLRDIDQKTFKAPNGDEGSSHTPSAACIIGGAGMGVGGPWTAGRGCIIRPSGGANRYVFDRNDANDAFQLAAAHPSATKTLLRTIDDVHTPRGNEVLLDPGTFVTVAGAPGVRFLDRLDVHGDGTIASVLLTFYVASSHGAIPQYITRLRIIRVDADGNVEALRASDDITDPDGFQFCDDGSGTWTSGAVKTYSYACNQHQLVDLAAYTYWAEIIEESGTNAWSTAGSGNQYMSTLVTMTGIHLLHERH